MLVATGVNASGVREILGLDIGSAEDGAAWTAFLRGLVARGLSGVRLVVSDAHQGFKQALAAVLEGAAWQRCRTHFMRNLLTRVPRSAQAMVGSLMRTIFARERPRTPGASWDARPAERGQAGGRRRAARALPLTGANQATMSYRIKWLRAEMLKTRLTHGLCTRDPVAGPCPYANICEQCDNLTPTRDFTPILQAQLDDVRALRDDARSRGCDDDTARHERAIASLEAHLQHVNKKL